MDKDKKIRKVLVYLNNKISVVNQSETEEVKEILEDDDITLKEVVEWYIDYVVSLLVFCSGCVTTRATVTCNKTIDLTGQPDNGRMNVGVRLELFRDWTR